MNVEQFKIFNRKLGYFLDVEKLSGSQMAAIEKFYIDTYNSAVKDCDESIEMECDDTTVISNCYINHDSILKNLIK